MMCAGILSDGWARKQGGQRYIGTVVRGWTFDCELIERTVGICPVDVFVERS
jgi:hypothetical protein